MLDKILNTDIVVKDVCFPTSKALDGSDELSTSRRQHGSKWLFMEDVFVCPYLRFN
jgi:hypothetical protein